MLANQVLDFHDDKPRSILKKIAHKIPADFLTKSFTKVASQAQSHAIEIITKQGSALQKFPTTSPADTLLSNLYFEETHTRMPAEAQKICASFLKVASLSQGVPVPAVVETLSLPKTPDTNKYDEARGSFMAAFEKKASATFVPRPQAEEGKTVYALPTLKKYAMPDVSYVQKAEEYFEKHASIMDPETRKEFGENLSRRAKELGHTLSKEAALKFSSNTYVRDPKEALAIRDSLVKVATHRRVLKKMASFVDKTQPKEFVDAIFLFDKKAGLQKYYGKNLQDPYLHLLQGAPISKTASYKYKEEYTGQFLTGQDLTRAFEKKASKIKEYFGESLADGLKKHGIEAFEALPKDTKSIIGQIAVGAI